MFGESLHFMDLDVTAYWNERLGNESVNKSNVSAFVSSRGDDASWHSRVFVCRGRRCVWSSWSRDSGPARCEFDQVWNWLLVLESCPVAVSSELLCTAPDKVCEWGGIQEDQDSIGFHVHILGRISGRDGCDGWSVFIPPKLEREYIQ